MPPAAASDLRPFLEGRPARPNAAADPWALIGRALAGAGRPAWPLIKRAVGALSSSLGWSWRALAEAGVIPAPWLDDDSRGFVRHDVVVAGVLMPVRIPARPGPAARYIETDPFGVRVPPSRLHEDVRAGDLVGRLPGRADDFYVRAVSDAPTTATLAAAVAAGAPDVPQAEELVREASARMAPWGGAPARLVAWELLRHPRKAAPIRSGDLLERIGGAVSEAFPPTPDDVRRMEEAERAASRPDDTCLLAGVRQIALEHLSWRAAARSGRRVEIRIPYGAQPDPGLAGAFYRDLPDPFEPLLELAAMGYSARSPVGDVVRVFAPELPPRSWE